MNARAVFTDEHAIDLDDLELDRLAVSIADDHLGLGFAFLYDDPGTRTTDQHSQHAEHRESHRLEDA